MTVREMLTRIDSRELTEWVAYYNMNPWGPERADLNAGIIASTVANCHATKGKFRPRDFMVDYGKRNRPPQTPEQIMDRVKLIHAMLGGKTRKAS